MTAPATAEPTAPAVPKRRWIELVLTVAAVLIAAFGYADVGANLNGRVPLDTVKYGAGLGALALLAHLAVRFRAPYADPLLLPCAVLLNGLGLVVIYRLDHATGASAAPTQLVWSAIGVLFFILVVWLLRDHRVLQRYAYVGILVGLVLMVIPIGMPAVYGAKVWIKIGPLSFQPGEIAKLLLAVFIAAYLAVNRESLALTGRRIWRIELPRARVIGPVLAVWAACVLVLFVEQDLGTGLIFFGLFVVMLYAATGRSGWIAVGILMVAVLAVAVGELEPHVHSRVQDWLHPLAGTDQGRTGQLAQSLFAFAAGGLLGTGLGLGHSYLIGFAANADWILATFGEELGLVGLAALLLIYAVLVGRGVRCGIAVRDPFGRLLAIGLAALLALQVFVVAGGVSDLIPLTGMTMPFLAQGGSSLVTNWILIALLIRLSDVARRPAAPPVPLSVEHDPATADSTPEPAEGLGPPTCPADDPARPDAPPDARPDARSDAAPAAEPVAEAGPETVPTAGARAPGAAVEQSPEPGAEAETEPGAGAGAGAEAVPGAEPGAGAGSGTRPRPAAADGRSGRAGRKETGGGPGKRGRRGGRGA